jgi:type IV secretion system protein VirB3
MADVSSLPPGYSVPVHRSLTSPILLAGAPRLATIVNGTLAAALGIGLQLWVVGLVFWIVAQGLCVFVARRDPQFTDVLIRHIRQKAYYAC